MSKFIKVVFELIPVIPILQAVVTTTFIVQMARQ